MVMAPIDVRKPFPPKCQPPIDIKPGGPLKLDPAVIDKFQFAMKDKDKDGGLSLDEWVRSEKGEITMADVEKFKRYDRDGDGKVDQKEFLAGRAWDRRVQEWFKNGVYGAKEGIQEGLKDIGSFFKKAAS
jgi:hypothetical protein